MATTDVDVCNSALLLLGEETISSLTEDESDQAVLLARLYPPFKQARIEQYPWRWATTKAQLARNAAAPAYEWQYQFTLPPESLRLLEVFNSGEVGAVPFTRFERQGDSLLSDEVALWCDYLENKSESDWPRLFEDFVSNALASRIAVGITGKTSLAQYFKEEAYGVAQERGEGGLYAQCKAWDSSQSPPRQVIDNSLIEARFGGGSSAVDARLR